MNPNRPIYLNLWRLKFPVMAIASILHRISGVVIFLCLPFLLYLFHQSLDSQNRFDQLAANLQHLGFKLMLWIILIAVVYHWLAGVRHLIMDLGYGESVVSGRRSAYTVIILSLLSALLCGVWLWHV